MILRNWIWLKRTKLYCISINFIALSHCTSPAGFVQPMGLCSEGSTLCVTDPASGNVKMVSPVRYDIITNVLQLRSYVHTSSWNHCCYEPAGNLPSSYQREHVKIPSQWMSSRGWNLLVLLWNLVCQILKNLSSIWVILSVEMALPAALRNWETVVSWPRPTNLLNICRYQSPQLWSWWPITEYDNVFNLANN